MNLKIYDAINELLNNTLKDNPTIKKIILTTHTGFHTIAYASKSLEYLIEIDEMGAIASHLFHVSADLGQNLELNDLNLISFRFNNGNLYIASCGGAIICFYTESDVELIKSVILSLERELKRLINEYLRDPIIEAIKLPENFSEIPYNIEK